MCYPQCPGIYLRSCLSAHHTLANNKRTRANPDDEEQVAALGFSPTRNGRLFRRILVRGLQELCHDRLHRLRQNRQQCKLLLPRHPGEQEFWHQLRVS